MLLNRKDHIIVQCVIFVSLICKYFLSKIRDHHCPWVDNCIGFYNRKYFMQLLFYLTLITIYIDFSMGYDIYKIILEIIKFKLKYSDKFSAGSVVLFNFPSAINFSSVFLLSNSSCVISLTVALLFSASFCFFNLSSSSCFFFFAASFCCLSSCFFKNLLKLLSICFHAVPKSYLLVILLLSLKKSDFL